MFVFSHKSFVADSATLRQEQGDLSCAGAYDIALCLTPDEVDYGQETMSGMSPGAACDRLSRKTQRHAYPHVRAIPGRATSLSAGRINGAIGKPIKSKEPSANKSTENSTNTRTQRISGSITSAIQSGWRHGNTPTTSRTERRNSHGDGTTTTRTEPRRPRGGGTITGRTETQCSRASGALIMNSKPASAAQTP